MVDVTLRIINEKGLHARASAKMRSVTSTINSLDIGSGI